VAAVADWLAGVMVDEEHGAWVSARWRLIVIQEELGYALAPTPCSPPWPAGC